MWTLGIVSGVCLGVVLCCSLLMKVSVGAATTVANGYLVILERIGGQFPANGFAVALSLVFGLGAGSLVYTAEVREAERRLVDAYFKSDVLADLLRDAPGYPITPRSLSQRDQKVCANDPTCPVSREGAPADAFALLVWIEKLGLSNRTISPEDLTDPTQPFARLASHFGVRQSTTPGDPVDYTVAKRPTLWVALDIARVLGRSAGRAGSPSEKRIHFELAAALARLPSEPYFFGGTAKHFLYLASRAPIDILCPPTASSAGRQTLPPVKAASFVEDQSGLRIECSTQREYEQRTIAPPSGGSMDLSIDQRFKLLLRSKIGWGFRFVRPAAVSTDLLLQALYQRVSGYSKDSKLARIAALYTGNESQQISENDANETQQLEMLVRFQRALLKALETSADVKEARQALDFWVGYEQFALVCLALFVAALLFAQWLRDLPNIAAKTLVALTVKRAIPGNQVVATDRLRLAKAARQAIDARFGNNSSAANSLIPVALLDTAILELEGTVGPGTPVETLEAWSRQLTEAVEDSRWLFGWCLSALPAIGFLGTVRGILNALGDADAVSSAQDKAAQAIAIGNVSGSLSLAFSTTLIALVAVLILSLLDQWQAYVSRRVVEDTELLLTERVQPKRA